MCHKRPKYKINAINNLNDQKMTYNKFVESFIVKCYPYNFYYKSFSGLLMRDVKMFTEADEGGNNFMSTH